MYLSSRFAACVGIAAVLAAGTAARAELAARPAFAGIRPTIVSRAPRFPYAGIAPTIVGRRDLYPGAGIRPTVVPRFRRGFGNRFGYGGYGLGYDGTTAADFGTAAPYPPAPGPLEPPPFAALPPIPPPCPQIIEIGGGLKHKATTRIVSGARCRR